LASRNRGLTHARDVQKADSAVARVDRLRKGDKNPEKNACGNLRMKDLTSVSTLIAGKPWADVNETKGRYQN